MTYRKEIDGIRAIAVLAVILFHAGFKFFSGGFVGVDVFFVISGYLITSIIIIERNNGKFSLRNFYERRARRILPALFAMLCATIPFAWLWLMPFDMKNYSQSLAAVTVFSSNILFFKEAGYFDTVTEFKPLLHTWSLAVEEQFYLLYPLLLMLIWKINKRFIVGILSIIGLCSFFFAQLASVHNPPAAFFLLPARIWELMIGALIAFYLTFAKKKQLHSGFNLITNELFSISGILFISYAIFTYDNTTPFPGVYALVPTLGTALIILFASPETIVGRMLGCRLLVNIGLISYSAYLWHYPMFVFLRYRSLAVIDFKYYIVLSIMTLLIAFVMWKFVEQPFRKKRIVKTTQIFWFFAASAGIIFTFGVSGHLLKGFEKRFPADISKVYTVKNETNPKREICLNPDVTKGLPVKECLSDIRFNSRVLLWGDSQADTIASALEEMLSKRHIAMRQFTHSACVPVVGLVKTHYPQEISCVEFNNAVMNYIEKEDSEDYIVLIARWTLNYDGNRFDNGEGGVEYGINGAVQPINEPVIDESARQMLVAEFYQNQITRLLSLGKKVILVYPVPEAGWDVPRRLSLEWSRNGYIQGDFSSTSHNVFKARNNKVYEILDGVMENKNLFRIIPEQVFCNTYVKGRCITHLSGTPLYRDSFHLSNYGARLVVDEIVKEIQ